MQLKTAATSRTLPHVIFILAVLALVPLFFQSARLQELLTIAVIYAIAVVALDLFAGYSGQFSFGQFAFVGLGAYGATALRTVYGFPFAASAAGAMAICAVIAAVVGLAMVRLPHLGSALTTFFLAFVVGNALGSRLLAPWTGGHSGLYVPPVQLFGIPLAVGPSLYYVSLATLLGAALLTSRYAESRAGRALRLIKQNEVAASVIGVHVNGAKLTAFVFSAAVAGAAGVLLSLAVGYLSPESFAPAESIIVFAMLAVGGFGTIAGPIVGALFFTLLPELFIKAGATRSLMFSSALLLSLVFLPGGIYSLIHRLAKRARPAVSSSDAASHESADAAPPRGEGAQPTHRANEEGVLLDVKDLSVRFGDTLVVNNVSVQVASGTVHALIGPNGAGKTTLLNCISGIQPTVHGRVLLGVEDISGLPAPARCRRGLARTFQHPALVQDLTVLENVRLGVYGTEHGWLVEDLLWSRRMARRERRSAELAHLSLDRLNFPAARRNVPASELTLAEQKIVDIARALAGSPRVILLDEPSAGLSEREMETIGEAIRKTRRPGLAVVVIAHHVKFVAAISDRVTVLNLGEVLAEGSPADVLELNDVREVFIGV